MLWLIYARTSPFLSVFGWIPRSRILRCKQRSHPLPPLPPSWPLPPWWQHQGGPLSRLLVGMGVGFLGCFRHASEKGKKKWEKICFFVGAILSTRNEGQNRTNLPKWNEYKLVQIVVYPLLPRLSPFHLGVEKIARKLRNMHISPAVLLGTVNLEWWNLSILLAVFRVQKSQSPDGSWGAWMR